MVQKRALLIPSNMVWQWRHNICIQHFVFHQKKTLIASSKFTFPLSCFQATTYRPSDGFPGAEPWFDRSTSKFKRAHKSGMDLSTTFLPEYNSDHHKNVSILMGGTHAFQRMFRNHNAPATATLQHVRYEHYINCWATSSSVSFYAVSWRTMMH
jgi:hypothetical protein